MAHSMVVPYTFRRLTISRLLNLAKFRRLQNEVRNEKKNNNKCLENEIRSLEYQPVRVAFI